MINSLLEITEKFSFDDSDLCLFKYFPHERFVIPLIIPGRQLECTCTLYWLQSNVHRYKHELKIVADYKMNYQDVNELNSFKKIYKYTSNYTKIFDDYSKRKDLKIHSDFSDFYIRPYTPTRLDLVISIWIIGQFWREILHLFDIGLYNYLYSPVNTVNFIMSVIYIISYSLEYYTMGMVKASLDTISKQSFWNKLSMLSNKSSNETQLEFYFTFYWLNAGIFI
jgi:hypothetical protein